MGNVPSPLATPINNNFPKGVNKSQQSSMTPIRKREFQENNSTINFLGLDHLDKGKM